MLITPGQGLLTILLGIFLLADEIPFFGRIRDRLQRKFPRTADYLHRKQARIQQRYPHFNGQVDHTDEKQPTENH